MSSNTGLNAILEESNDILRSCYSVIARRGADTNWDTLQVQVKHVLQKQHEALHQPTVPPGPAEEKESKSAKQRFYEYGQSLGIKINDLQRLRLLTKEMDAELQPPPQPSGREIKTFHDWNENHEDLELDKYLNLYDEVDEELYLHMGGVVAPQYCTRDFLQVGEADKYVDGVYFYTTFSHVNGKYYYLGSLPEFKQ